MHCIILFELFILEVFLIVSYVAKKTSKDVDVMPTPEIKSGVFMFPNGDKYGKFISLPP